MAYRRPDHPDNRQEKVKAWFTANPGPHAARTVAEALGLPAQPVAMDCTRLWRKGVLVRTVRTKAGNTRGVSTYEIASTP